MGGRRSAAPPVGGVVVESAIIRQRDAMIDVAAEERYVSLRIVTH